MMAGRALPMAPMPWETRPEILGAMVPSLVVMLERPPLSHLKTPPAFWPAAPRPPTPSPVPPRRLLRLPKGLRRNSKIPLGAPRLS